MSSIVAPRPHRRLLTSRLAWLAVGLWLLATLAVVTGVGGSDVSVAVADGASVVAALGGAWIVIRSARGRPVDRVPWLLLGVAMVLWGVGEVLWSWYEIVIGEVPYPSIADVSYLGAVPFAIAGLLAFARGSRAGFHLRTLLDASLIAASLLFITWALVLGPAWRTDSAGLASHVVTVAYPITDLILATLALILVQSDVTRDRWSLRLLAAAALVMAIADSAFGWIITTYGTFSSSNPITMLWPAAYLLIAFATAFRDGPTTKGPEERARLGSVLAPYIPLVGSMAVAAPRFIEGRPLGPFLTINGIVLIALVLVRQAITAWDLRAAVAVLHEREAELERLAAADALTGLANRARFASRLDAALDIHGAQPGVVFIDLDGFKQINDQFGHAAGDDLLVEVSNRLRACTTSDMELARLGGDEFVILVPAGQRAAEEVAQRVLESFALAFHRDGESIPFRASLGVASAPPGASPDEAVRRADAAMYVAKSTGKGHAVTYPDEVEI